MSQSSGRLMRMRQKALTEASLPPAHCLHTDATSRQLFPTGICPDLIRAPRRQHDDPQWPATGKALPGMNQSAVHLSMAWFAL